MKDQEKEWEIVTPSRKDNKKYSVNEVISILLKNREVVGGVKREFFKPKDPRTINPETLGLKGQHLKKAADRIKEAIGKKEKIIIYGDYDTDGVCASAILWETLFDMGANVLPYIPNRFEEGYGLNSESVEKIKSENKNLGLIITVDNGIVALDAVDKATDLGIDTIITDHHQKGKKIPLAFEIIHTDQTSGSGISWIFARQIQKRILGKTKKVDDGLELAAIGTVADQLPLIGINRAIAKYGFEELGRTKRPGFVELFKESGIYKRNDFIADIGTYEVNYIIAPRINAMGRLEHAIDSLRLVCTKSKSRARELAIHLSTTNQRRQKIVEKVLVHARKLAIKKKWKGVIVLHDSSYHEGVIGLAAGKLVEEFGRPAIVISEGRKLSKGSARSIPGFNIIEVIRKSEKLLEGAGGHPMAAGLKLKSENLEKFVKDVQKNSKTLLTPDILQKKLRIDTEIGFSLITSELYKELEEFEPVGIGNPRPVFVSKKVEVTDARTVGLDGKHLKLLLTSEGCTFEAIGFGLGDKMIRLKPGSEIDIAFSIDENVWNGRKNLQLRIKDIHFS